MFELKKIEWIRTTLEDMIMALHQFRQHGNVTHIFDHQILGEIVNIICQACPVFDVPPSEVYWGIHRIRPAVKSDLLRIGIQTETYRDEFALKLGSRMSLPRLLRMVLTYDFIIDINQTNWYLYKTLPKFLRRKVLLGPYIFPDERRFASVDCGSNAVFIGSLNERRKGILNSISDEFSVDIVPDKTFGPALKSSLLNAWCLLNVHYYKGVYTEYPRLLQAISCGKPIISETLDSILTAGYHYTKFEDLFRLSMEEVRTEAYVHFDHLSLHLTSNYSFNSGLRHCLAL
jgi:hypothetical protein